MDNNTTKDLFWIYIWRMCPVHAGHEQIIRMMRERFKDRFLLILGSSNTAFSLRNFFNYAERREFIRIIYPDQKIVGLPDYSSDKEWLLALDDIISNIFSISHDEIKEKVIFAWGCDEDVDFFHQDGRRVEIVNRFDGTTPKISATEVRDALIHDRVLEWMLNEKIINEARNLFATKWEKFKKI